MSIEELKKCVNEYTEENEKLRQELEMKNKCEVKLEQYESEINGLKKSMREKEEVIQGNMTIKEEYKILE